MEEVIEVEERKPDAKSKNMELILVFLAFGILLGLFALVADLNIGYKFGFVFCAIAGTLMAIAMTFLALLCREDGESATITAQSILLAIVAGILVFSISILGYSAVIFFKKMFAN